MSLTAQSDNFTFTIESNAVDSLSHAAQFFAYRKTKSELKLAVLLVFHAIELLLKAKLSTFEHNLIFTNSKRNRTIDFDAAKGQLGKRAIRCSKSENRTLVALQDLRNDLEHHELKSKLSHVETCVRNALKFADAFSERELNLSVRKHLGSRKYKQLFSDIYNDHEKLFKVVIDKFSKQEVGAYQYWSCPNCGKDELVVPEKIKHNVRVQCAGCKRKYYISVCVECGNSELSAQSFGTGEEPFHCGCPIDGEPVDRAS